MFCSPPPPLPRRINIGSRYQAEVPELRQRTAVELDPHRADLVWAPLTALEEKPDFKQKGWSGCRVSAPSSIHSPNIGRPHVVWKKKIAWSAFSSNVCHLVSENRLFVMSQREPIPLPGQ